MSSPCSPVLVAGAMGSGLRGGLPLARCAGGRLLAWFNVVLAPPDSRAWHVVRRNEERAATTPGAPRPTSNQPPQAGPRSQLLVLLAAAAAATTGSTTGCGATAAAVLPRPTVAPRPAHFHDGASQTRNTRSARNYAYKWRCRYRYRAYKWRYRYRYRRLPAAAPQPTARSPAAAAAAAAELASPISHGTDGTGCYWLATAPRCH
jgi:hypothetical protein